MEYFFLFIVSTLTACVGSMVGGGAAFITIPLLIGAGLDPKMAIATSGLLLGSSMRYLRDEKSRAYIAWPYTFLFFVLGVFGSYMGTQLLLNLNQGVIVTVTGISMLVMLPFLFFKRQAHSQRVSVSILRKIFGVIAYFVAVYYGTVFAAGAGFVVTVVTIFFFGLSLFESDGITVIAGILRNVFGVELFAIHHLIQWEYGSVMFVAMILGGYLGRHYAFKVGEKYVKVAFGCSVVVAIVLIF